MALMGASSLFFLVAAFAVRGQSWAVAITLAIVSLATILLVQAAFFFAAWLFATIATSFQRPKASEDTSSTLARPTSG